jgi:hypothetical protein
MVLPLVTIASYVSSTSSTKPFGVAGPEHPARRRMPVATQRHDVIDAGRL